MKKRRYLLAVVAALALPLLVSCGKKAESKETSKATESAVSMAAAETSSSASTSATGEIDGHFTSSPVHVMTPPKL